MRGSAAFRTGGALAPGWVKNELWRKARAVPSLDLRFADNKSLVDATTGASLVTFTRASSGTFVGSDRVLRTATTNEPRFDHNPTTGESLGLLVEEARTNLFLQSNQFDTTWTNANSSETAASGTAPDGTNTAWALKDTLDVISTSHQVIQAITFTSGVTYTFTCWLKAGTLTQGGFVFPTAAFSTTINCRINLLTGSVIASSATLSTSTTLFPNGWVRVTAVATATATAGGGVAIRIMDGATSYIGTGNGTILIWGAQLEAGAFPTSYIPTTTATVTRAADVASVTGTNFSSWANNNEGTIFSDSSIIASQIKTQAVWELSGGIALSSLRQPQGTANQFRAVIGGTFTGSPGTGASLTTGVTLAAVAYSGTAGRLQIGSVGTDGTGSTLDATSLSIGSLAGASQLNGRIKRLCFWPARLPDATLQQITQ